MRKNMDLRRNWRCRREEYLRATGRCDELISEGYKAAPLSPQWAVLPGGRRGNAKGHPGSIRLCLVKGSEIMTRILGNAR
jgi:hypothetical protein